MLATVAATDSANTVRKKYSVFIYREGEPHAMYAIYKQTLTLYVLQYCIMTIFRAMIKHQRNKDASSPRAVHEPQSIQQITHYHFTVYSQIVVWTYHAFGNNSGIKNDFIKYLKKSCWWCSD